MKEALVSAFFPLDRYIAPAAIATAKLLSLPHIAAETNFSGYANRALPFRADDISPGRDPAEASDIHTVPHSRSKLR